MVGFDPRGVNRSEPVECLTDEEMDTFREQVQEEALDEEEALEEAREQASWLAEQCEEGTGRSSGMWTRSQPHGTWTSSGPRWVRRS